MIMLIISIAWIGILSSTHAEEMEEPCDLGDYLVIEKNQNGSATVTCLPCTMCPPGSGTLTECQGTKDTECTNCTEGTSHSRLLGDQRVCEPCTDCASRHHVTLSLCSLYDDAVCGQCLQGYELDHGVNCLPTLPDDNSPTQDLGHIPTSHTDLLLSKKVAIGVAVTSPKTLSSENGIGMNSDGRDTHALTSSGVKAIGSSKSISISEMAIIISLCVITSIVTTIIIMHFCIKRKGKLSLLISGKISNSIEERCDLIPNEQLSPNDDIENGDQEHMQPIGNEPLIDRNDSDKDYANEEGAVGIHTQGERLAVPKLRQISVSEESGYEGSPKNSPHIMQDAEVLILKQHDEVAIHGAAVNDRGVSNTADIDKGVHHVGAADQETRFTQDSKQDDPHELTNVSNENKSSIMVLDVRIGESDTNDELQCHHI